MRIRRRVLLLLTMFVVGYVFCSAQTPRKEATASIAGHVTIHGKAAPEITIVATLHNSFFDDKTVAKTVTDEDGDYKLTGLTAGSFTVLALAKSYVVASGNSYKEPGQNVNLVEGEAVTKVDFVLVRGGVVTGRITDADGHPVIGEQVNIALKDGIDSRAQFMNGQTRNQTDDRGIYRAYGLGPGSYKVSVGQAAPTAGATTFVGTGSSQYWKTFFPGVEDESRATILEIKEGTEIANVDITVNKPSSGFAISGRVIDADSGKPVASVYIGHSVLDESNQQIGEMNFGGTQSDANGKFRLEGLRPGHYAVYTMASSQENTMYSEQMTIDIADADVTGIEIKLRRGATVNGIAVIENNSDPAVAALLQSVSLYTFVERKSSAPSYSQSRIAADGSFQMAGLAPGKARFGMQGFPVPPKGLTLMRTELEGLDQKEEGIEIAAGAQINGVKLVFAYGTGSIRGEVKIEGGSLPDGILLRCAVRSAGSDSRRFDRIADLDSRLHFIVENIPPGNYELVVFGVKHRPGAKPTAPVEYLKQPISVANGAESRVSLVVDLTAKEGSQP